MVNSKNISVGVFCGSMNGFDETYLSCAKKLGCLISENTWNLIYGGGNLGLMGAVALGFDKNKADLISIIPESLNNKNILYPNPTKKILVKSLFARKERMINESDFIVVLPGGVGTLDEMLDIIALNNLKITNKKIIVLNINNFWKPLKTLLSNIQKNQFIDDFKRCHINFIDSIDKTINFIKNNL